jgi:hypothetical protein
MRRVSIKSENLASVGYDDTTSTLEIEFRNGHLYRYFVVPKRVYDELRLSPSPGNFFTSRIKDRYTFQRLV